MVHGASALITARSTTEQSRTFLIPMVEELLDEMCNAKFFTKLALRFGYH
jgi:hypothetical protein